MTYVDDMLQLIRAMTGFASFPIPADPRIAFTD